MVHSKQTNPLVSVIIPHWNGYPVLKECLQSLEKTDYPALEVIIVDNGSEDGSPDSISKDFPKYKLIQNKNNEGYAGGCNRGAENAAGKYLLFLNNDTIQDPDWITHLVESLESNPDAVASQPKILNYFNRKNFDYAGGCGGHIDIFGFPLARGRIFNIVEEDKGQYNSVSQIFWSSGTAFLILKDAFMNAGKFDESFFAHMEEIDLCWRLHLMGQNIIACPEAVVYHRNAATLPMFTHWKYYLNHRNSLFMQLTNYSVITTLYIYPLRLAFEGIASIYALSKLDFAHFTAIVRAQFYLLFHPLHILRKRRQIKQIRKISDRKLMSKMVQKSVVVGHYLLRKKTWSDFEVRRSK